MSRFAKKEISFDLEKIQVICEGSLIKARGPKGENSFQLPENVNMNENNGKLKFSFLVDSKNTAKLGLSFRMVENLIIGVTLGFSKKLEMTGVGYRWNINAQKLNMQLGFSHEVVYNIPEGITITVDGNSLTVSGVDKSLVGLVAAKIRGYRPVEPYKGKGIKYSDEYVIRKVGKAGS